MKPAQSRIRFAIRHHGLNWITAVLTATAIALTLAALVSAAGAADRSGGFGTPELPAERAELSSRVERAFVERLDRAAADLDLYIQALHAAFERSARELHGELEGTVEVYRNGGRSRDFDRAVKALDVRLDLLAKRIDRLGTHGLANEHKPVPGLPSRY